MNAIAEIPVEAHNPRMGRRKKTDAAAEPVKKRRPGTSIFARIDPAVAKDFQDYVDNHSRPRPSFAQHLEAAMVEYLQRRQPGADIPE